MMNGKYINQEGKESLYYMGCYGIGVSRTTAIIYEANVIKDKNGIPCGFALPENIAPYKYQIIPKMDDEEKVKLAEKIYTSLKEKGIDCILDDRENVSIGAKIKDCKVLGTPNIIVLGDKMEEKCGVFGIKSRAEKPLAHSVYYGLYALQHRGQESAGIVVNHDRGKNKNRTR